jgi:hypothetical protein
LQILRVDSLVVVEQPEAQGMQTRWHLQDFSQLDLVVVVAAVLLPQAAVQAAQVDFLLLVVEVEELLDLHQERPAQVALEPMGLQLLQPTSNQ